MTNKSNVREWLFRGLMFESEAEKFRSAGIRIGADQTEAERNLLVQTLEPFGIDLRNEALQMARLYALVYCFENSVRRVIQERLFEKYGSEWWISKVPNKVKQYAEERKEAATKDGWLEGQKKDLL